MKRHQRSAFAIYLIMTGADWLISSLFTTVVYVYLAKYVTDDPFQLVLISTVFTITVFLFEIPTGVVADVYSRRLSVIIGFTLLGIGALVEGVFQIFELVLLSQVVLGVGFTFISGARDAWITDEIGEERVGQAYLRGSQVGQIGFLVAIPISTALGTIALNLPIVLAGTLFLLLAVFLVMVMPEEGFQHRSEEEHKSWRTMFRTLSEGVRLVRGRTVLIAILLISAVYGLSSSGFDNLWTVNILENLTFPSIGNFEPVVWFGLFNIVVTILGLAGTEISRRKVDISSQAGIVRILMFLTSATAICMVIFGLTRDFWLAATVYCLSITFRRTSDPILRTWITQNTETNVRATVLSMDSQVNSVGQVIGGSAIGAIGSVISLPAALVTTGLARVPVAMLFARLVLQDKRKREETLERRIEI
ncbi:MAG TPA: MFS transporter [Anaerolineae bacterium]|nr:MFS transporter [Anaerolineae bacterium]